jgi:hypothetical protein
MMNSELGFGFRSVGRGFKKVGKAAGHATVASARFAAKSSISVGKLAAKLALLPLIYLRKAVTQLGRVLCSAPPEVLAEIAAANGISPSFVPAFCEAVRVNSWGFSNIKRYLPTALKLALKLGASGAFPPIVPALAIVRAIPGVGQFASADFGASFDEQHFKAAPLRASMAALEMTAFADYLGLLDEADARVLKLSHKDRATMQNVFAGALGGISDPAFGQGVAIAGMAALPVLGVYLALRK